MSFTVPGINIFDFAVFCAIAVAARSGYHLGLAESFWTTLRWVLILAVGTYAWRPFGAYIAAETGWNLGTCAVLAYLLSGAGVWIVVDLLRRKFATRLLLAIPAGPVDGVFGSLGCMAAVASASLVVFALISPFEGGAVDWNPMGLETSQALGEFGRAIFTTVRKAAFDDSFLGRTLQESFRMLLIRPELNLSPDLSAV